MKIAELRAKPKDELKELFANLKKEQFNLRFQAATGALENKNRKGEVRKTIARVLTLLNAPEGVAAKAKAEKKPVKKAKKG